MITSLIVDIYPKTTFYEDYPLTICEKLKNGKKGQNLKQSDFEKIEKTCSHTIYFSSFIQAFWGEKSQWYLQNWLIYD